MSLLPLYLVNNTGSTRTYLTGAISVPGNSSLLITNAAQKFLLYLDGTLRADIISGLMSISDGVNTYGVSDAVNYLLNLLDGAGATSDGYGNPITSQTNGSQQALDVRDQSNGPVTPGTAAALSNLIGGQYNSTLPSPSTGQQAALQLDYKGRLIPSPQSLSYFHPIFTTRVQSVTAVTTILSTSLVATIAATKAGNTIIVSACCNAGTLTITDSASQSYSTATTIAGQATETSKIFYFPNTAAGVTTVTISSTSSTDLNLIVTEYSGTLTASPLDKTSTNGQTAVTSWTSNATTTIAQASELLIGSCMGTLHNNDVFTPGTNWFSIATVLNTRGGANLTLFMEDQYVSTVGTYAATGTVSVSDNFYGAIATFKLVTPNMISPPGMATTLKSSQGTLANVNINTIGTGGASVTFYDSTTASGTVIANLNLTGEVSSLEYGLHFTNGLTMVANSSTADFTVVYD